MFSFSPPPGGTKIGCCVVFCCVLSTVSVSIQVISFRLLVVELFSCLIAAEVLTSLKNLRQAAPNFHARRRLTRESPNRRRNLRLAFSQPWQSRNISALGRDCRSRTNPNGGIRPALLEHNARTTEGHRGRPRPVLRHRAERSKPCPRR